MAKLTASTVAVMIFILPFVAMYFYADAKCVPAQHTKDFCPGWIASGMVLPAMFWVMFAAVAWLWCSAIAASKGAAVVPEQRGAAISTSPFDGGAK